MSTNTRYDFEAYPWPVKPALLYLMELPADTSQEDYLKRWDEIFHSIKLNGGKFNNLLLEKHLQQIMHEQKVDYTRACSLAMQTSKGRKLVGAATDRTFQQG